MTVILVLVSRHWWAGTVAAVVAAGCIASQLPLFVAAAATRALRRS